MGEDECDLFSVKLEDIHLARHSSIALNNQPTNQLSAGFVQKKKHEEVLSGIVGNGQYSLSNYWQQLFDDAQPVVPQDIILPNLIAEESVDFSRDFFFNKPCTTDTDSQDLNAIPAPSTSPSLFDLPSSNAAIIPSAVRDSPVPFNRSRPASPNPKDEHGSEKKRVKFERSGVLEMGPPQNGLVYFESQNVASKEIVLSRKSSTTQSIIVQSGYNGDLTCQPSLTTGFSGARYVTTQNPAQNLSVSPVMSSPYMERRFSNQSGGSNIMIHQSAANGILNGQSNASNILISQPVTSGFLGNQSASSSVMSSQSVANGILLSQSISRILSPDSTEQPAQRTGTMHPPLERSYSHSRSVSTSPEPRDELDRKEGRNRDKNSSRDKVPRHKRPSHINAEQRRRSKIQGGIEELNLLIPPIPGDSRASVGTSKKSNAALLGRAAGYCRQLKAECRERERESESLRSQIESLTADINDYHEILPADGVTQTKVVTSVSMEQMFYSYVRNNIHKNWKFYIFGLLIRPFFESYNRMVAATSLRDFPAAVVRWTQECFTLSALRLNTTPVFRHISKKTSFMMTPENLPQEALELSATIGRSHIDGSGNTVVSSSFSSTSSPAPNFTASKSSSPEGAYSDR